MSPIQTLRTRTEHVILSELIFFLCWTKTKSSLDVHWNFVIINMQTHHDINFCYLSTLINFYLYWLKYIVSDKIKCLMSPGRPFSLMLFGPACLYIGKYLFTGLHLQTGQRKIQMRSTNIYVWKINSMQKGSPLKC